MPAWANVRVETLNPKPWTEKDLDQIWRQATRGRSIGMRTPPGLWFRGPTRNLIRLPTLKLKPCNPKLNPKPQNFLGLLACLGLSVSVCQWYANSDLAVMPSDPSVGFCPWVHPLSVRVSSTQGVIRRSPEVAWPWVCSGRETFEKVPCVFTTPRTWTVFGAPMCA